MADYIKKTTWKEFEDDSKTEVIRSTYTENTKPLQKVEEDAVALFYLTGDKVKKCHSNARNAIKTSYRFAHWFSLAVGLFAALAFYINTAGMPIVLRSFSMVVIMIGIHLLLRMLSGLQVKMEADANKEISRFISKTLRLIISITILMLSSLFGIESLFFKGDVINTRINKEKQDMLVEIDRLKEQKYKKEAQKEFLGGVILNDFNFSSQCECDFNPESQKSCSSDGLSGWIERGIMSEPSEAKGEGKLCRAKRAKVTIITDKIDLLTEEVEAIDGSIEDIRARSDGKLKAILIPSTLEYFDTTIELFTTNGVALFAGIVMSILFMSIEFFLVFIMITRKSFESIGEDSREYKSYKEWCEIVEKNTEVEEKISTPGYDSHEISIDDEVANRVAKNVKGIQQELDRVKKEIKRKKEEVVTQSTANEKAKIQDEIKKEEEERYQLENQEIELEKEKIKLLKLQEQLKHEKDKDKNFPSKDSREV